MGRLSVISDMDGVIYRGRELIPGAQDFVAHLRSQDIPFLFLTNNSEQTPLDLVRKLEALGIHGLTEENFITAAIATAAFLNAQRPRSTRLRAGRQRTGVRAVQGRATRSPSPARSTSWWARPPTSASPPCARPRS